MVNQTFYIVFPFSYGTDLFEPCFETAENENTEFFFSLSAMFVWRQN